ncbi:odorant receptor 131-2-like [Synchiropus splendidus]|uniref:odorant receptor 131-2-like n=1 Tax=Synchiropus splendidus TaxID=270530 RepID=UPI00237EB96C|nr:odorant receptor 131-2-like [Synchiropus splendidus]
MTSNSTTGSQYQGVVEKVLLASLTFIPSCTFFTVNVIMLFTLRSKPVFRETSGFVLLFNRLFADTFSLAMGQLMYLLASMRIQLTYPVCGFLISINSLAANISPLTLVVMSMERYVAVCFPLRHPSIVTIRTTVWAISLVWSYSCLILLVRVGLMCQFPFHELETLMMEDTCGSLILWLLPEAAQFDTVYRLFLFISTGAIIVGSLAVVILAARSSSERQRSARKIRDTMSLHVFQLGLSLLSTMHSGMLRATFKIVSRITLVRIKNVLYVCSFICPHCLSSLIYGLREAAIRPVLLSNLGWRLKVSTVKTHVSARNW